MTLKIIYEDDDLLVIDKPAGVVVNKAATVKEETVQDWSEKNLEFRIKNLELKKEELDFRNRAGIVHRLDKETSGILLIAKNPNSFENLQNQFKERTVVKRYLSLVHGLVKPKEGQIDIPIGRLPWRSARFGVFPGGKEAKTKYRVLDYYRREKEDAFEEYSFLQAAPFTGRTHQIRVHLKYLGHPVVGDEFYAGRKTAKKDREWCPRLFLHAGFIKFKHPISNKWMEINCQLPNDLEEVIKKLSN